MCLCIYRSALPRDRESLVLDLHLVFGISLLSTAEGFNTADYTATLVIRGNPRVCYLFRRMPEFECLLFPYRNVLIYSLELVFSHTIDFAGSDGMAHHARSQAESHRKLERYVGLGSRIWPRFNPVDIRVGSGAAYSLMAGHSSLRRPSTPLGAASMDSLVPMRAISLESCTQHSPSPS